MTSSKKLYTRVAGVLAGEYNTYRGNANGEVLIENITASLADVFAQDNDRFDRSLFYQAVLGRDSVRPIELCNFCREAYDPRFGHRCSMVKSGTVISGTLRSEDLIRAFEDVLSALNAARCQELHKMYSTQPDAPDLADEYIEQLSDAINECAPEGMYFGAHPGDPADFGWWKSEEDDV